MSDSYDTYVCGVCGHEHNEETDGKWENLAKFWLCPECGCHKDEYTKL